jgi:hypothetical protein
MDNQTIVNKKVRRGTEDQSCLDTYISHPTH